MATKKSFSDIRASILKPAMTSQYHVYINFPGKVKTYLVNKNIDLTQGGVRENNLNLSCIEASLPGSSLATLELTSDHTGVTEKHVHRRMFDDRIDLTFLVDATEYLPIKAFEYWKEFIVSGSGEERSTDLSSANHSYRMQYPDDYMTNSPGPGGGGALKVVKFERDFDGSFRTERGIINGTGSGLTYNFVRAFPISVTSMPISYDTSSLLKCTVSMSYIRYYITDGIGDSDSVSSPPSQANTTPLQQLEAANRNDAFGNTAGPGTQFGERDTATGALMNGGSDAPPITARQAAGLDPI